MGRGSMEQFPSPPRIISQGRCRKSPRRFGGTMRTLTKSIGVSAIILVALSGTLATARPAADDNKTIVIIFKDGHRQSLAVAEIARLDFKSPSVIIYRDGHHEK